MSLQSMNLCHFTASAQEACMHAHPTGTLNVPKKWARRIFTFP